MRRIILGYLSFFLILSGLNGLFWFTANFQSFSPPGSGPFRERLFLFLLTEFGPISSFVDNLRYFDLILLLECCLLGGISPFLIFVGLRFPGRRLARIEGYFGIFWLIFLGFARAGLRIT